jgi:predicted RNA methylase
MSLHGTSRVKHDLFFTPAHATRTLLDHAREIGLFRRGVECWECAAGAGHIARVLAEAGLPVLATDVAPAEPALYPVSMMDFLTSSGPSGQRLNIITNPPYGAESRLILAFLRHALDLMESRLGAIALLLPFEFDSRIKRAALVGDHPWFVGKVTLATRIKWANVKHKPRKGPMGHHAWYLWSNERAVQMKARARPMMVTR